MSRISSILFICVLIGVSYGLQMPDSEQDRETRDLFAESLSREQRWNFDKPTFKKFVSENIDVINRLVDKALGRRDIGEDRETRDVFPETLSREQRWWWWDKVKNFLSENKDTISGLVNKAFGRRDVNENFQTSDDQ